MQRDTWIRSRVNPEINVQFTGDLDVRKPLNGAEEAFGVITVVPERSYLKYLGKEFLIQRGSLTFNGDPLNPILDLESVYEVRSRRSTTENEATITLNLAGPFDNLNPPELVSDPPMEVADQVSYILFGRPSDESLKLSSNNLNVSDFAIGTLAGALEDLASSRLGLDVVEIEQREDQRMVLTAGRYLNSRVYVAVSQPISTSLTGEGSLLAIEEGLSGYTVEYQIVDQVLLRLLGNGAVIRLNLQWTYTF
jgi:translocation and assembly module TamB